MIARHVDCEAHYYMAHDCMSHGLHVTWNEIACHMDCMSHDCMPHDCMSYDSMSHDCISH